MSFKKWIFWQAVLFCGVLFMGIPGSAGAISFEFAQVYHGPDDPSIRFGEALADPELSMDNQSLSIDWNSWESTGYHASYGVYFIPIGEENSASVILDTGSSLDFIHDTDRPFFNLAGIAIGEFDEAHVSLLNDSSVNIGLSGAAELNSVGIALVNISLSDTASVELDGGSSIVISTEAVGDNPRSGAVGLVLLDNVHAKATLDNQSSISVEAVATTAGFSGDATAMARGVQTTSEWVEVTLAGGSGITATAEAALDEEATEGRSSAAATGIFSDGRGLNDGFETNNRLAINLSKGSSVLAEAISGDDAESYGINASTFGHAEVLLDQDSHVSAFSFARKGEASATAIRLNQVVDRRTAIVSLDNGSSVRAIAGGVSSADAIGVEMDDDVHAVLNMDNESNLFAGAISFGDDDLGESDASAYGVKATGEIVAVSLDHASNILTSTMTFGEGSSSSAHGIYADVSDIFELSLNNGSVIGLEVYDSGSSESYDNHGVYAKGNETGELHVSLDNESKIEANVFRSGQDGGVSGLTLVDADVATVSLSNDSIIQAEGLAQGEANYVDPTALYIAGVAEAAVTLDSGSQLISTHIADSDSPDPYAYGLEIYEADSAEVTLLRNSRITVSSSAIGDSPNDSMSWGLLLEEVAVLDLTLAGNSLIDVTATNDGTDANAAYACGIEIINVETANIALTDGSKIVARAKTNSTGTATSGGLYNENSTATLTLDATSSISADYAVYDEGIGQTTIHNSGLLAGRLDVAAINNSNSGVLQATFGSGDGFAYTGEGDDFYFLADSANLASGSTLRINPTDNLGLNVIGDAAGYALLQTDDGSWNQANLQLTSTDSSSLLGLSWHADSDENQLIATATFLSPEQAGLSGNATRAFEAAMADGLFTFATDPSAWVPDVSGAYLAGMTQSLANSQVNIGNRLSGLLGLNSGDEVTADKGMWFSARYTGADQSRRDGIDGFEADTMAFSIGHDREFKNAVLGLAYTYGDSDADADDGRSDFDMDDHLFSLYGSYDAVTWYSEAILSIGFGSVDGNRVNAGQIYRSDFDSNSYNAKVETGMKLSAKSWQINPLVGMEYSRKSYDSYTESGDELALHIGSQDYDVLKLGAGAKAHKEFLYSLGWVTPEVYALLNHDLVTDRIVSTANFIGGSTSFVAKGVEPSRTSWDLGAAVTLSGLEEENLSFRLGYDYSGREDFQAHSVTGKIRIEF